MQFKKFTNLRQHVAKRLQDGDAVNVIFREDGIPKEYIRRIRYEEGIAPLSHGNGASIRDFSKIDKKLADGETDQNIAKQLGHTDQTIASRRKKLGIEKSNTVPQSTKEEIIRLCDQPEMLSMRHIARIAGVDFHTVIKVIDQSVTKHPKEAHGQTVQTISGVQVTGHKARTARHKRARKVAGSK